MRRLSERWNALFSSRPAGYPEVLLIALLAMATRNSLSAIFRQDAAFYSSAAFDPVAIGVDPVGWAAWFPTSWVLSQAFDKLIAFFTCAGCIFWAMKRLLPWSALTATVSWGIWVSLQQSREFNYRHESLPGVALMMIFASVYVFRRREIRTALADHSFWFADIYPAWFVPLFLFYMGSYYTFGGITKVLTAGSDVGSGLTLQLLMGLPERAPMAARPILDHRWLATVSMTTAVILEVGAVVMFFVPRIRPLWAIGLILLHLMVLLAMKIAFLFNMLILAWIAIPGDKWLPIVRHQLAQIVGVIQVPISRMNPASHFIVDTLYAFDVLGLLEIKRSGLDKPRETGPPTLNLSGSN